MRRADAAAATIVVVCATAVAVAAQAAPTGSNSATRPNPLDEQLVRVALAVGVSQTRVSATSEWRIYEADGSTLVATAEAGDVWRFEPDGRRLRVIGGAGVSTDYHEGRLVVRPAAWGGFVVHGGRRYRGDFVVHASDGGLTLVNRLPVDEYLKGVVPMEIGSTRTMEEFAAAEAQAVAARSYTYVRLGWTGARRLYDLRPTVIDQAYGGVNAETIVGTRAVESTAGLVLKYEGRLANAPYHSTCGGETAEAPEVWPIGGEPFLRRVSDRVPGTDRFYCDISPRFRWTREVTGDRLDAAVGRYLRQYVRVPVGGPGHVRAVSVVSRTPSGRVETLAIKAERGDAYTISGNDARFVLRSASGEILNSPWFDIALTPTGGGRVSRLTVRGAGYGHGVGMCQWGAIGRARAGQGFRTILDAYFPGTTVEPVY